MQNLELTEMFSCPSRVCPFGKTKNKSVILLKNEIFKDSVSFHFGGKAFNFSAGEQWGDVMGDRLARLESTVEQLRSTVESLKQRIDVLEAAAAASAAAEREALEGRHCQLRSSAASPHPRFL